MTEFIAEQWGNINWQTVMTALVAFIPVALGLFALIAKHSRELLASEKELTKELLATNEEQQNQIRKLEVEKMSLEAAYGAASSDVLQEVVDLSDEEARVLKATSSNRIHDLYRSNTISSQRISLANDRLSRAGLIALGTNGYFATPNGREWLELNGLLD